MESNVTSTGDEREQVAEVISHLFPQRSRPLIERMTEGVSTRVYQLSFDTETFYLRVLPELDSTFAPEALVHDLLQRQGILVPKVIHVEDRNELLQRSIMVTTAIPGESIVRHEQDVHTRHVLEEAGRSLAIINSIGVEGYGWIRRKPQPGPRTTLEAELASYRGFVDDAIDHHLAILQSSSMSPLEIAKLERIAHRYRGGIDPRPAVLAHGDFDATHIFQAGRRFSGIIDFGEIRGTDPWYDLGQFRLHDGEQLPAGLFQWLLAGYHSVRPEQPGDDERIVFASLLIAARSLARASVKNSSNSSYLALLYRSIKRDLEILDG